MKKNNFYKVLGNRFAKIALATSLLVSAGVSSLTPVLQIAEAASTKTFTSEESYNQTITQTFAVPDLTKLNSVSTNTGNATVEGVNGNLVTVKMSDGTSIKTVQTGGVYSPADTKFVTGQTSSYYNQDGYSGSLSTYLYSGSYTPGDTKHIVRTGSGWSDSGCGGFEIYPDWYQQDGYIGPLYVTKCRSIGGYNYDLTWEGDVTRPASDTRVYRYQGNVAKPALDTRTYSNVYQYQLTFDYETDIIPPSLSLTSNNTPTNQDVSVEVQATDEGGIKQIKWAKGNQPESYFTKQGTVVSNNTFSVSENGTYSVYAEDFSGNMTVKTIEINNIDKNGPVPAKIIASTTSITNQDISINIEFPNDATIKEYRLDGGTWTSYSAALILSANSTVEARSKDAVGNVSEIALYQLNNIDKENPTIQSVSILNDYLTIKTNDGSGVAKTEIKINNGPYQSYQDGKFKVIQNTEVNVRVTDVAGNFIEETYSLTSDVYYQKLLKQLQSVQTEVDLGGKSQFDLEDLLIILDNIKQDSNELVLASERTDVEKKALELIKQIQAIIDVLNKVKVELEDLGDNPTQIELDKMKELIEALPPGPEKEKLLEELEKKQNLKDLEDARKLVNELGDNPTQAEIDHVRVIVEDLADSDGKTELLDIIKDKQLNLDKLVEEATKAVNDLNERSTSEEVKHTKDLINKLPNGPKKDELLEKLKEKEQAIKDRIALDELLTKAEAAVKHAENYPTYFNIESAEKAVNTLPVVPEKIGLLDRIEAIKDNLQFEEAKKKVEQAERYERDPYLAEAIKLVDILKESDRKQELKDRLQVIVDKLQEQKDSEDQTKGADGEFDPTNPDSSLEDAINSIQDPEAKKFFTKWHKANNNASKFFSRAMTTNATKVKDELPASYTTKASYTNLIAELTTRTNNLATAWEEASKDKLTEQLFSKAYSLVDLYDASKNERNYKNALSAIASLPDGAAKTALQKQLESMKKHPEEENSNPTHNSKEAIEQAEKAVANYEKYKSSYYQKKALEAIDTLIESDEKTAFQLRLSLINK